MTRQQEGDEAAPAMCECGHAAISHVLSSKTGKSYCRACNCNDFDWKQPLPTPEETTLPAMDGSLVLPDFDWKRMEEVAADELCTPEEHPDHEECVACMAIKGTRWALQMRSKLTALEAERDALKDERDELVDKNRQFDALCKKLEGLVDKACDHGEELQARLDAVVGQETPQDIWERGFEQGWLTSNDGIECEVPPYMPPPPH